MMMYKEQLENLCREQTNLTELDIDFLVRRADSIMESSNYASEDVFIDVKNAYSDDATVVFHKKPELRPSLYETRVVGNTATLQNEPAVIRTLNTGVPSVGLSGVSQEGVRIQQTVFPIVREKQVIGTLILERDASQIVDSPFVLTENRVIDYRPDSLRQFSSAEQFSFLEHMDDAILVFNKEGNLTYFNQMAAETYRAKLAYMDAIDSLHYDNLILGHSRFDDIKTHSQDLGQSYLRTAELTYGSYYFLVKQYVIPETGSVVVVCKDVTSSRQTEAQLLNTEMVLREMNHRVKNNLQTVVSLLRLQAQRSQDIDVKKSLYDSVNRVLSIAMTHELLSLQKTDQVLIDELLQAVIDNVQHCFQGRLDINFTYRIQPGISLDSNRATSVALVINELLQNSYDHAFNDLLQKNPRIHLQVDCESDIIKIELTDNGSGYDVDKSFDDRLGLMIVERFVKSKLLGKLFIQSGYGGTLTRITFKINSI